MKSSDYRMSLTRKREERVRRRRPKRQVSKALLFVPKFNYSHCGRGESTEQEATIANVADCYIFVLMVLYYIAPLITCPYASRIPPTQWIFSQIPFCKKTIAWPNLHDTDHAMITYEAYWLTFSAPSKVNSLSFSLDLCSSTLLQNTPMFPLKPTPPLSTS